MTPKMQAYKQSLVSACERREPGPCRAKNLTERVPIPNLLPIPAFLVAALMRTYSSDAATLCLAAINAIKERASKAGEDPLRSQNASSAAYVATWLWNVARRDRTERLKCVQIGPVSNPRADEWSRSCH